MKSNWRISEVEENAINEFSTRLDIDKSIASILLSRGLTDISEAYNFLNPKLSSLHSPFLMNGMYECVTRIRDAVANNEKVGIFSDSDVDGLTSLAILANLLERLGIKPYYRFAINDEDYGLRKEVIDEMHNIQIDLLITLDCGIRDIAEIEYAGILGIDVIVCDHHEQADNLPAALIVNPKLRDSKYPFKELAGVGVTFKLCHGMLMSYLQSFNRTFVVITKDEDGIYLSFIKNGIIEKIKKINDLPDLNTLSDDTPVDCNIILFDVSEEEVGRIIKDRKIYCFNDLLCMVFGNKFFSGISFDELCTRFSINRKIFDKKHEIINFIFSEIEYNNSLKISEFLNSIIDLVSIGTIADIMPVSGENRTIVYYGLKSLNSTNHPGMSLLIKDFSGSVTAKKVSWDISPLLNTPGRFGKTGLIADFFLEKDMKKLSSVISEIKILNDNRKKFISDLFDVFVSEMETGKYITGENLIFIVSEKVPEGLCGLLANRISGSTGKPVIIISLSDNKEVVKGSGRTTGDYNFFSVAENCSHLFEKIGGHKQAFGFSIKQDRIEKLREIISGSVGNNSLRIADYNIDLDIPIEAINYRFINNLNLFEPYGHKNNECLFLTRKAVLRDFKRFGKKMNHGKYMFQKNTAIEAVGWDMAEIMETYLGKKEIDIVYRLENNFYNNNYFPRMLIVDLD
jgi:single-stranded-DNA-specific exonuclease